jgi:predicted AlkP superfamily pyrophosphatase or phosphodiesterase
MSRRCFLLLIDGLHPGVAESELKAGHLPSLARLVAQGGVNRAITAFPSTTSVSYLPFLTGCTPGRCNVPSIRWLDRTRYDGRWWSNRGAVRSYCGWQAGHLDGDIDPDVRTLFELVPESAGIFTMIARGLSADREPGREERKFWGAFAHYAEWHQPSDEAVAGHLLRQVETDKRFVFAQFPAVDGYSHQSRADAPKVLRALRRVDAVVGRLLDRLEARKELAETLVLLVSDHGSSVVHTHLDLADWFRTCLLYNISEPTIH